MVDTRITAITSRYPILEHPLTAAFIRFGPGLYLFIDQESKLSIGILADRERR